MAHITAHPGTEIPVYPRGYCALIHRANHRLPDGRTQIVITDHSVMHPSMAASAHFIFMTVYPSGMLITPVQQGARICSHVKLISHFDLRGTISPSLLQRLRAHRMLEACCFNYLHEFRNHVHTHYPFRADGAAKGSAPSIEPQAAGGAPPSQPRYGQ